MKTGCLYLYRIATGTIDVYKSAEAVKLCGGKIALNQLSTTRLLHPWILKVGDRYDF